MREPKTTAPAHPNASTTGDTPPDWSPADLVRDFLNPTYTLLDLCQIHRLTLPQLERTLDHPWLAGCHRRLARQCFIATQSTLPCTESRTYQPKPLNTPRHFVHFPYERGQDHAPNHFTAITAHFRRSSQVR
ncbi:MAG: hypothetical protein AAF297_00210 [Planctomycetota bacterium]